MSADQPATTHDLALVSEFGSLSFFKLCVEGYYADFLAEINAFVILCSYVVTTKGRCRIYIMNGRLINLLCGMKCILRKRE